MTDDGPVSEPQLAPQGEQHSASQVCAGSCPSDSTKLLAWHSPTAWATLIIVFAAGLLLDLGTKRLAFERVAGYPMTLASAEEVAKPNYRLPWHEGVHVLPAELLDLRLVLNHGAVFGIGQHQRGMFIAFTMTAIAAAVWVFGWWTKANSRLAHIAIGLILAGGMGNLHDRMFVGAVRDFLHMLPNWNLPFGLHWPGGLTEVFPWVFNVADMLLLAGMSLLLIHSWIEDSHKAKEAAREQPSKV